jgi:acetyltransferase-like isoleucine patch superfamily enzyme
VIQGVIIGENSVIGAGTSVVRNLDKNSVCTPAAITKRLSSYQ